MLAPYKLSSVSVSVSVYESRSSVKTAERIELVLAYPALYSAPHLQRLRHFPSGTLSQTLDLEISLGYADRCHVLLNCIVVFLLMFLLM